MMSSARTSITPDRKDKYRKAWDFISAMRVKIIRTVSQEKQRGVALLDIVLFWPARP